MKTLHAAVGLLIWFQAGALASQSFPVRVLIATPASTIRSGATVRINVTITNATDHTLEIEKHREGYGHAEDTNDVTVYDQDGTLLPLDINPIRLGTSMVMLQPGKSFQDFFMLSDLADLKKPGTYKVQAHHEFWQDNLSTNQSTRLLIPSNTLAITVTK